MKHTKWCASLRDLQPGRITGCSACDANDPRHLHNWSCDCNEMPGETTEHTHGCPFCDGVWFHKDEPEECMLPDIAICECCTCSTVRTLVESHFPENNTAQGRAGVLASEAYNLGVQVGIRIAGLAQQLMNGSKLV